MLNTKKQTTVKLLTGVLLVFFLGMNIYPWMMGNDGGRGYDGDDSGARGFTIEYHIIQGAGYFLNAYSDALLLSNRVELADLNGLDNQDLQAILGRAIENMEKARDTYAALVDKARRTPYRLEFIQKLLAFDYRGLEKERGLNGNTFAEVTAHLEKGDITGVFDRILARTQALLDLLYRVKEETAATGSPAVPTLWRVNDGFAHALMFGQYAAEVFGGVKGDTI